LVSVLWNLWVQKIVMVWTRERKHEW